MRVSSGRRQQGFLNKIRYGGTTQNHRRNFTFQTPRLKTDFGGRLKRDTSFHVSTGIAKQCGAFSWAKMSAAMASEEERLSPISSKEDSEEMKRKISFGHHRHDVGCQTDACLLDSIMHMPYLTRKKSQRMQRTKAIDEDYASVKFSPNNSMKVRFHKRVPLEPGQEIRRRNTAGVPGVKPLPQNEGRTFLFPGYSDSPISTSDDIENEEDFEYYESISDLLRAHRITPNYTNENIPVCTNDKSMSTYLNPLGNRDICDSLESESDNKTNNTDCISPDSDHTTTELSPLVEDKHVTRDPLRLVLDNHVNGHLTSEDKIKMKNSSTTESNKSSPDSKPHIESNSLLYTRDSIQRHSVCSEVPSPQSSANSINFMRRHSSTPVFHHASPQLINLSTYNEHEAQRNRRFSGMLSGSSQTVLLDTSLPSSSDCSTAHTSFVEIHNHPDTDFDNDDDDDCDDEEIHDESTSDFVNACDKEEKSMLEFQTFLRQRGVELDMAFIESSEV